MAAPAVVQAASLLERYPVLGICGSSGAGKTTLIEALIPRLHSLRLKVAVVKHGAHNVRVDAPGKDSDRFFQTGADVSLFGEECFTRWHGRGNFTSFLRDLCNVYDLVLVEGHARTDIPKIWLLGQGYTTPPENKGRILEVLTRAQTEVDRVAGFLQQWLNQKMLQTPVWGCVLIGGKSRRMGQPKHLIERSNRTWLEYAVETLESKVDRVVLLGDGHVPAVLAGLARIPDVPGLVGPLAGILAAMRWHPRVSWLVMACDLPDVKQESLQWLLDSRRPGIQAILPDLRADGHLEPLLAWYDFRSRQALEKIAASGSLRISQLAGQTGIHHLQPPGHLLGSWRNVNTPDELKR